MAGKSKKDANESELPFDVIPQKSIPKKAQKLGSGSIIASQLPGLIGAHELSSAYKVVIPEGVTGHLMRMKSNGLLTTSIVGDSNLIVGQAGLQQLGGLASPMVVFSVMSMITGQYFMSQINKSLTELSESVEEIQRQVDTSEESTVFSSMVFLQELKNDWNLILASEDYKKCVMSNLLKNISDLAASSYYFVNRLSSKLSELERSVSGKKPKIEDELIQEIERIKTFLKYAYELRSHMKVMLVFLSSGITVDNAAEVKQALKNDAEMMFSYTVKQLDSVIDSTIDALIHVSKIDLKEKAKEIQPEIIEIRSITRDAYNDVVMTNVVDTVDRFAKLDSEKTVFYVCGDELFVDYLE